MFAPDLGTRHEKAMVLVLHDIARLKGLSGWKPVREAVEGPIAFSHQTSLSWRFERSLYRREE
jgi:hypothetical protein